MRVLRITALPQSREVDVTRVLRTLCVELARESGVRPEAFWATWETLEPWRYVEGDAPAQHQPASTHPPLVELVAFEGRSADQVERLLERCAGVLARELRLKDGNVFVLYREAASGRVFTGGQVRRT